MLDRSSVRFGKFGRTTGSVRFGDSVKYHIFKQSKFFSIVLVRSTVWYGSVRFCIFFRGSVRWFGKILGSV